MPESGYTLVSIDSDSFASPDEDALYFIAHFEIEANAEAELARRQERDPLDRLFVYGPRLR